MPGLTYCYDPCNLLAFANDANMSVVNITLALPAAKLAMVHAKQNIGSTVHFGPPVLSVARIDSRSTRTSLVNPLSLRFGYRLVPLCLSQQPDPF